MVRAVRSGKSVRVVAREFGVSVSTVALWIERARGKRLDRVDFSDRAPGCARAWNRVATAVEQRILELRRSLRENSILGEYGAKAIEMALRAENAAAVPDSPATPTKLGSSTAMRAAIVSRRADAPRNFSTIAIICTSPYPCTGKLAVRESGPNCPHGAVIGLLSTFSAARSTHGSYRPSRTRRRSVRDRA